MKYVLPIAASAVASACCLLLSQWASGGGAAMAQVSVPGTFSRPAGGVPAKAAAWPQSAWVKGHNSAVRLIGGAAPGANGGRRLLVGVELALAEGWKTYWRHPGDDGGLPPAFVWDQSRNLASARVMYPAPERIKSLNGTTVGYAKTVIFPVEIAAQDAGLPVELVLSLEYGICREICVPAEARIALVLEPRLAAMPPDLAANLARVPAAVSGVAMQKILKSAKATLTGAQPALVFEIVAGSAGGAPDLFVEPPMGAHLPVPAKSGAVAGGVHRFRIDLKGVEDAPRLAGKALRLTVTGSGGGSEFEWVVK